MQRKRKELCILPEIRSSIDQSLSQGETAKHGQSDGQMMALNRGDDEHL
jgi:hypothetical protein